MWATSRSEEPAMAGLLQLGSSPVQPVQGTDHLSQSRRTDTQVQHGGLDVTVPEQRLDVGQLRAVLQQMGGEAVPQGMSGNPLAQSGSLAQSAHHPLDGPVVDRLLRRPTIEQPVDWPILPKIAA